jgi:ATP diphosphatase
MQNISRLLAIMEKLRDPQGGCPWDLQQTYKTIVPHTLEEAYEVADTIERQQYDELRDELGDLLFQIVFYAQLAKEEQRFEFDDVVEAICDKLERRHPHVFGDVSYDNAEEQTAAWEALKKQERANKQVQQKSSVLDGIAQNLPAISLAQKIQQRVARVGFDWPDWHGVLEKVIEETDEVRNAWANAQARQEEIGDLLFACINLARHADCDAEASLRHANRKFTERFQQLESLAEQEGIVLEHASLDTLEALWKRAKSATE